MKRIGTTIFIALLAAQTVFAAPVDSGKARQVAQHFWQRSLQQRGQLQQVEWRYANFYLFVGQQGGFVIVAADDVVKPLLGYSAESPFSVDDMPVQLSEWLNGYEQEIEWARTHEVEPEAADRAMWDLLLAGGALKGGDQVEPLLKTKWDQSPYYNYYCPNNTVAGCVAISQAQVMRFWSWPYIGKGSHKYTHTKWGTLSADFGQQCYDWDIMPNQLTGSTPTEIVRPTALMIYHVGVSVDMDYNTAIAGGSGAVGLTGEPGYPSMDNSLKDHFRYSKEMQPIFKSDYTNSKWAKALADELQLGHPIIYCGVSNAGGHAFVCDGYDKRVDGSYFHFNFGWSGTGDGYFTVDDISPNVSPTGVIGGNFTFDKQNSALLGCVPDYQMVVTDTLFNLPRAASDDSLIFCDNPSLDAPWTVASDQPWLTLSDTSFVHHGTVRFSAQANGTGVERTAHITFTQGSEALTVTVVQTGYEAADLCPLFVSMHSRQGKGWRGGAHVSFRSLAGYTYGSASLDSGAVGTDTVMVAPHDVVAVWNSGGGTDRDIDYSIVNSRGDTLIAVEYAYRNGRDLYIEWPCAKTLVDEAEQPMLRLSPNPVVDVLAVDGLEPGNRLELVDMTGRTVLQQEVVATHVEVDMRSLPSGIYLLRCGLLASKVVKR